MSLARFNPYGEICEIPEGTRIAALEEWRTRLTAREYDAIAATLNERIDRLDYVRAQSLAAPAGEGEPWLPVLEPLRRAMGDDGALAADFLGLIVWELIGARNETWLFHKYAPRDRAEFDLVREIHALEYFRAQPLSWAEQPEREEAGVTSVRG